MILLVPILVITLMYFMFENAPTSSKNPVAVEQRPSDPAGPFPVFRDVHNLPRSQCNRNGGAHPDHSAALAQSAAHLQDRILDCRGYPSCRGMHRRFGCSVLIPQEALYGYS